MKPFAWTFVLHFPIFHTIYVKKVTNPKNRKFSWPNSKGFFLQHIKVRSKTRGYSSHLLGLAPQFRDCQKLIKEQSYRPPKFEIWIFNIKSQRKCLGCSRNASYHELRQNWLGLTILPTSGDFFYNCYGKYPIFSLTLDISLILTLNWLKLKFMSFTN